MSEQPLRERLVGDTPIAVVDLETTGLSSDSERIVEISVVKVEPGGEPVVVIDTLVNPGRRVTGTEIHGITDADVRDAPTFGELKPVIREALGGAAIASYNVYFDMRFLQAEFGDGSLDSAPHLCLMYMRPMLGLGKRVTLGDACREHGVQRTGSHAAASDAYAAAALWLTYRKAMGEKNIKTFADLAKLKKYKFNASFDSPILRGTGQPPTIAMKPRATGPGVAPKMDPIAEYWDAMLAALEDFELSDEEIDDLDRKRRSAGVSDEQLRWVHARAFAFAITYLGRDEAISAQEALILARFAAALRRLGWAPGDVGLSAPPAPVRRGFLATLFGW